MNLENRKGRVPVGTDAKIASMLERLLPVSYWTLVERMMKSKTRKESR